MSFFTDYEKHVSEREKEGVPPLALNAKQTSEICELIKLAGNSSSDENAQNELKFLINLLTNRINPGVDDAAKIKAEFLGEVIDGLKIDGLDVVHAIKILGKMLGGYNVEILVRALKNSDDVIAQAAANELKNIILVHEHFDEIAKLVNSNKFAKEVLLSWANAEWFAHKKPLDECINAVVFKVPGETNTDDLSPASEAYTRADIPLHAKAMLVKKMPEGLEILKELKSLGKSVAYVGDVVGTGSSRKSGINSIQWHLGDEIEGVPNKKTGGIVIGTTIAPIFFNTAEDSGALPIVANVNELEMGDEIEIYPFKGEIYKLAGNEKKLVANFKLSPNTLSEALGLGEEQIFIKPDQPKELGGGYTLAQKMVGKACGKAGVRAGAYVEPEILTVGSQDTTGPMTRDEIKELASLSFGADFVLQSFCHTAAYPKPSDLEMQKSLPKFMTLRGGVSLKPGDGVIHSWLNRMVLPDTVGTGGDSHTRFPIGISFPAGSGLVAFAAVLGMMPLNMPESVLIKFKGELKEGVTLRDLVNAIPYSAIKKGLLSVEKKNKKNIFAGKILEIEGLESLKVEQAFELSDASAERSAAACVVNLSEASVTEYVRSNVALIDAMIKAGYESHETLARRKEKMQKWLENPTLLRADKDARYAEILEIDLSQIDEPILACPNDPDDVATLSEILADSKRAHNIDEVFVGSCMTNIGHYRALARILERESKLTTRLWIAPPTKMDKKTLEDEGVYEIFKRLNARTEVPGCSLCMGNQARVNDNAVVFSTSTRNFDNRMGMGAKVYLGSAELAAVCALLGRLPSVSEYKKIVRDSLSLNKDQIYKYLNFNEISEFSI